LLPTNAASTIDRVAKPAAIHHTGGEHAEDPEALTVETFAASPGDGGRAGTVRAHGTAAGCDPPPNPDTLDDFTCLYLSCGGTCLLTGPCPYCGGHKRVDPTCEGDPGCG